MNAVHYISSKPLTISQIHSLMTAPHVLKLSTSAVQSIQCNYEYLQHKLSETKSPIYGVNTGFGSLCDTIIDPDNLGQLQINLVRSHACGMGEEVPSEIVRLMLLLKIQSLSYGYSGIALSTIERLIDFYNHDVLPVIYQQGSLGASGDLAPLAHLTLPLLAEGKVVYKGERMGSLELHEKLGWSPISLQAKEGLALLNGTQFMSAYGIHCILKGKILDYWADLVATLSIEAFNCNEQPFDALIHQIRPHQGQVDTAMRLRGWLEGSDLSVQPNKKVQDPYSFRCIPQVHGATKDTLRFVSHTLNTEINSVTDNPNVFSDEDQVISAGNFHGQPLALAMDYLGIAIAELANISERRTYQLISGQRDLPPFLVSNPGLNSGLMITQYTAASIVSQNKQLATPASIDSIVSSNGQEDHVSMGANSATKCARIIDNVERVLAIELMNAIQALEYRKNRQLAPFMKLIMHSYRTHVDSLTDDRVLYDDLNASLAFIKNFEIDPDLLF